jgi:hypothetical protein
LAKQLWDWCQMEGGSLWNYSQGEIHEALAAVGGDVEQLPAELAAVVGKRYVGGQLRCLSSFKRQVGTMCGSMK